MKQAWDKSDIEGRNAKGKQETKPQEAQARENQKQNKELNRDS